VKWGRPGLERAIGSQVDAISSQVDAISSQVDAIGSQVDAIGSQVDAIGSQVDAISSQVDAIGSQVELNHPIQRIPLLRRSPNPLDRRSQRLHLHTSPPRRPRHRRDMLLHQRPSNIITAPVQRLRRSI
jgi:outer membrane murein-binding lipoprotein Lpp